MEPDRTTFGRWGRRGVAWLVAAGCSMPVAALAQGGGDPARETTLPGGQLVVLAYAILWVGLVAYVGYLGRRQSALNDEVDQLEERIDETLGDSVADES